MYSVAAQLFCWLIVAGGGMLFSAVELQLKTWNMCTCGTFCSSLLIYLQRWINECVFLSFIFVHHYSLALFGVLFYQGDICVKIFASFLYDKVLYPAVSISFPLHTCVKHGDMITLLDPEFLIMHSSYCGFFFSLSLSKWAPSEESTETK